MISFNILSCLNYHKIVLDLSNPAASPYLSISDFFQTSGSIIVTHQELKCHKLVAQLIWNMPN